MTVAELKNKLNTFDPEKDVYIVLPDDNPLREGVSLNNVFEISGSNVATDNAVYLQSS